MAPGLGTGRSTGATDGRAYAPILTHDATETTPDEPSAARLIPQSSGSDVEGAHEKKDEGAHGIEMQHVHERGRDRSASESSALSVFSSSSSDDLTRAAPPRRLWPYSAEEERVVVRKFDRRLVLFVAALYMLSFLDRSNIGNARIAGMDADLRMTPTSTPAPPARDDWYEWALTAFYITYITFEWMALLWRVIPAHVYVTALVAGWGIAASLQALASSYPWLIAMRVLLGIGEAGFAGVPLYLAQFFKRDELAMRTAVFIAAAPLATTFAASLAWAIMSIGRHVASPIAPWRLLFLVEGFPSVMMAAAAWRVIPDAPDKADYLTRREKKLARLRLDMSGGDGGSADDAENARGYAATTNLEGNEAGAMYALADPAAWITAAMFFLTNMAYSSLPVFLPTILAAMGHDAVTAQALAVPPYMAAFVIVLATAHVSDRMSARAPLLIAHALASAAGYGILSISEGRWLGRNSIWRYLAVYPAAIGFFNVVVLLIAWNLNNQRGVRRQGAAFALFQVVGQCGPLVGTRLYPNGDAPLFLRGMRTMAAAMVGVALLGMVLRTLLCRRNGVLDAGAAEKVIRDEDAQGEADGLVARSHEHGGRMHAARQGRGTSFRYML
ncbi:major facilitator superfamily transporter [Ophiostoma piceae UAMH 11346]|uniref:Major facilitator superfamily transporter n=1 Tax=Ophiostoma piceae (strain UAMH 11346) TaxID=1262450 RepID=S3CAR6_OPHP1|nr:major facilitator superfamily transporter [Ophiostoma piceae UAMH 11346]